MQAQFEGVIRSPRRWALGDAETEFSLGLGVFLDGEMRQALRHFDRAIQLAPENKCHWYYRALTQKRLGNELRAERDIAVAVYLERRETIWSCTGAPPWLELFRDVDAALRQWMDSVRDLGGTALGPVRGFGTVS